MPPLLQPNPEPCTVQLRDRCVRSYTRTPCRTQTYFRWPRLEFTVAVNQHFTVWAEGLVGSTSEELAALRSGEGFRSYSRGALAQPTLPVHARAAPSRTPLMARYVECTRSTNRPRIFAHFRQHTQDSYVTNRGPSKTPTLSHQRGEFRSNLLGSDVPDLQEGPKESR